jgi:hypothetical protein
MSWFFYHKLTQTYRTSLIARDDIVRYAPNNMSRPNEEQLRHALDQAWLDYRQAAPSQKHATRKRCFALLKQLAAASNVGDASDGAHGSGLSAFSGEQQQGQEPLRQPGHGLTVERRPSQPSRVYQRRASHGMPPPRFGSRAQSA